MAAYLPNLPGAVIGMLATASIGAVWSSCSPDFGVQGVLDRFGQIEPKVLFAVDGYFTTAKPSMCCRGLRKLPRNCLHSKKSWSCPTPGRTAADEHPQRGRTCTISWRRIEPRDIDFEQLPFDHPLYIMYSSGTTGVPKCIVHGAGGTLLQHLKEHQLHTDLKRDDRLFYFTTCGWMMWNWLVSGLASGATLVLYDGSPFVRRGRMSVGLRRSRKHHHFRHRRQIY